MTTARTQVKIPFDYTPSSGVFDTLSTQMYEKFQLISLICLINPENAIDKLLTSVRLLKHSFARMQNISRNVSLFAELLLHKQVVSENKNIWPS